MSINLKVEGIIQHNIFTERNIIDWHEYKNNIINNFNNINFYENIENYVPLCGRSLHVSRPRMRKLLHSSIVLNNKIFEELGYDVYKSREQYDVTHKDICDLIEECVKILVKKQQSLSKFENYLLN